MTDIFCKIINGEIGDTADRAVFKDDDVIVIHDINPKAPVHLLVIPKKHYTSLSDFYEKDAALLGKLFIVAGKIAKQEGLDNGYRVIVNTGEDGGQAIPHMHIHLLGGKKLGPKLIK